MFWIYTLGAGVIQPNMQPDRYSLANIERMSQTITDLESLDSFAG